MTDLDAVRRKYREERDKWLGAISMRTTAILEDGTPDLFGGPS